MPTESQSKDYYAEINKKIRERKPRMAICYDFDKTLSPDDMQSFTLIPSFGIDKEVFWRETGELARANLMDNHLAWMFKLIQYSRFKGKSLKKEYFNKIGSEVVLYKGVETWFQKTREYAERKGIELEHYIISSGLKEIIEGSAIAPEITRIYASSYLYDADGIAEWPAQAINYTNKTQYIFRIAKGFMEEYDERVNNSMPDEQLRIPYENIVYIGDSETDIPCMRLVKTRGGYSIGVFDPDKDNRTRVYQLYKDGRLNFYAPADYSTRGLLMKYIRQIIDEVAARESMKTEQMILQQPVELFQVKKEISDILTNNSIKMTATERKNFQKIADSLGEIIPGNIN